MYKLFLIVWLAATPMLATAQTVFPFVSEPKGHFQLGLFNQGIEGLINPVRSVDGERLFSTQNGLQLGYFLRDQWMLQTALTHSYYQFAGKLETIEGEVNLRFLFPVWRLHLFAQAGGSVGGTTRNTLTNIAPLVARWGLEAQMRLGLTYHLNPRWSLEGSYGFRIPYYNDISGFEVRNVMTAAMRLGVNFRFNAR